MRLEPGEKLPGFKTLRFKTNTHETEPNVFTYQIEPDVFTHQTEKVTP